MNTDINIHYIVQWDKIKEKTWSGTCYSLFLALSQYVNLKEVRLNDISIWKKVILRIFVGKDLCRYKILKNRKILTPFLDKSQEKIYCIQFTDIIQDTNLIKTFVYQDLGVSYLKKLFIADPEMFKYSGFGNITMKNLLKREIMEKNYFKLCTAIFTMGKWYRNFLVEECKVDSSKVFHVGGGINLNKYNIDYSKKEENKILFVGRDFKRKGGELVYEAFSLLKKKHPELELHIAGPSKSPIKNPISGCYFYGDCTREELSSLFNKCDIFCMPSYFEAYGLVFIEALTYGLPCIGRNAFEMSNFIQDGETGFLINDDNIEDLSDKMYSLLKNQRIKKIVRDKKDYYIQEYSWNSVAKRMIKVITETQQLQNSKKYAKPNIE